MERGGGGQFSIGQLISGTRYRVRGLIGSGGMGSVYEVEHEELGKLFVLKALRSQLADREDLAARMKNEWRALGRLQHPNIVVVTDAGRTSEGVPFFVMERLDGETLGQRLRREGQLSLPLSVRICLSILDALAAAHAIGVVHRDIKPQNVFLSHGGTVKLLDFGVAKLKDKAAWVVTRRGVALGTPKYMSPEQAEGHPVDGRADIYAVALVLFELMAGRGPFAHHRDPNDLVLAHIAEAPPRLDRKRPEVPAEFADLVQRWLSKDPNDRPLDAGVAARELRRLLSRFGYDSGASFHESTVTANYDAATRAAVPRGAAVPAEEPLEPARPQAADGSPEAQGPEGTAPTPSPPPRGRKSETPPPVVPAIQQEVAELAWPRWASVAGASGGATFAILLLVVNLGSQPPPNSTRGSEMASGAALPQEVASAKAPAPEDAASAAAAKAPAPEDAASAIPKLLEAPTESSPATKEVKPPPSASALGPSRLSEPPAVPSALEARQSLVSQGTSRRPGRLREVAPEPSKAPAGAVLPDSGL